MPSGGRGGALASSGSGGGGGGGGGGTSSNKHYLGGGSGASGPWLHAWYDPVAWIKTVPSCVRLGDIFADGDSKLLICDLSRKLRMYKGAALVAEYALLDQPVAAIIVHGATTVSNSQVSQFMFYLLKCNNRSICTIYIKSLTACRAWAWRPAVIYLYTGT
jgi:hypothetical protein